MYFSCPLLGAGTGKIFVFCLRFCIFAVLYKKLNSRQKNDEENNDY